MTAPGQSPLAGFTTRTFTHGGASWPVHRAGSGPGVLVIHEVPGITAAVLAFARRLVAAGFTVELPQLFGVVGGGYEAVPTARALARACISREFTVLRAGRRSPITDALRALATALHADVGGPGVGAIGMCLTGNFALALVLDGPVVAPILSQPSLPFGLTGAHRADPHLHPGELEALAERCEADQIDVLGLRFTHDLLCPAARFDTLRGALGARFEAIEIPSGPGNPHGLRWDSHSVLTRDLVDEDGHPTRAALDRVLGFLSARLVE
jgi:dienelactone hydrolase